VALSRDRGANMEQQAFEGLKDAGRTVRRPDCTLVTVDHVSFFDGSLSVGPTGPDQ
jgi:hypothetical protein